MRPFQRSGTLIYVLSSYHLASLVKAISLNLRLLGAVKVARARGYLINTDAERRYSFRIVANPLHEQVGPNGDNHLDGYGIDAPINPRQLHIKHLEQPLMG